MKVTILTCDGCLRPLESERQARPLHVEGDFCADCRRGAEADLDAISFHDWPEWFSKATVRRILEQRDSEERRLRAQVSGARDRTRAVERELEQLRRRAAEGLSEDRLDVVLRDIASAADRKAVPQ